MAMSAKEKAERVLQRKIAREEKKEHTRLTERRGAILRDLYSIEYYKEDRKDNSATLQFPHEYKLTFDQFCGLSSFFGLESDMTIRAQIEDDYSCCGSHAQSNMIIDVTQIDFETFDRTTK